MPKAIEIYWTDPYSWLPQPGKICVGNQHLLPLLARGRAAGLHPFRLDALPGGWAVTWCGKGYVTELQPNQPPLDAQPELC